MLTRQLENEVLELLSDLIRIPSTASRPQEVARCADFICSWLDQHNIAYSRKENAKVPSVLVGTGETDPRVLLMTHFDVVEADDLDQFAPCRENGLLYGRGSIDDKYGVALSLVLYRERLRKIEAEGRKGEFPCFGLLFTGDEESGGAHGAGVVSQELEPDFFIAIDGGRPNHIVTKEKGILALKMEASGKAAHAARPWLGKNAFDTLTRDYLKIRELFAEETDDHWHRTMVLANCHAGNGATNIVPEKATATLDIRYTENDDPETLLSSIQQQCESEIILVDRAPVFISPPSSYLDLFVKHVKSVRVDAGVGFEHGASDARYLSIRGIPGAIWGADGQMSQHSDNEHVVIDSIFTVYNCLDSFLTDLEKETELEVRHREET